MSERPNLIFEDVSKKAVFEDLQPKLIFADESKKLIFDIIQPVRLGYPYTYPMLLS